jgi:hypothetical protein
MKNSENRVRISTKQLGHGEKLYMSQTSNELYTYLCQDPRKGFDKFVCMEDRTSLIVSLKNDFIYRPRTPKDVREDDIEIGDVFKIYGGIFTVVYMNHMYCVLVNDIDGTAETTSESKQNLLHRHQWIPK